MTQAAAAPAGTRAEPRVPRSRLRAAAAPLGAAAAVASATLVVGLVDPAQPGHFPLCPFRVLTGFACPVCGSLRATHDLAHLDIGGAIGMNPLFVAYVPVLLVLWLAWLRRAVSGRPRSWIAPAWLLWAQLALVLAFGVARNVPVLAPYLAP